MTEAREMERKWFFRTLLSSLATLLAYGTGLGIGWWGNKLTAEANLALANGHPEVLEQTGARMQPLFTAYKISLVTLLFAGLLFLVSLVFWLLSMRQRRGLKGS
ncbi:hypothetical protein [Luteolibacter sp. LG18]|uniref:hypothetical protein n=1 Tax=Luteolibacter sp. LG18 TaxID=2819286 RepID=UPI0030C6FC51